MTTFPVTTFREFGIIDLTLDINCPYDPMDILRLDMEIMYLCASVGTSCHYAHPRQRRVRVASGPFQTLRNGGMYLTTYYEQKNMSTI